MPKDPSPSDRADQAYHLARFATPTEHLSRWDTLHAVTDQLRQLETWRTQVDTDAAAGAHMITDRQDEDRITIDRELAALVPDLLGLLLASQPSGPSVTDAAAAFVSAFDNGPEDEQDLWSPADERLAALRGAIAAAR